MLKGHFDLTIEYKEMLLFKIFVQMCLVNFVQNLKRSKNYGFYVFVLNRHFKAKSTLVT